MIKKEILFETEEEGPVYVDENGILRWVYGNKPVDESKNNNGR